MALPVIKAKGADMAESFQSPGQAGGGILTAGKDDQSGLIRQRPVSGGILSEAFAHGVTGQKGQIRAGA